MSGVTRNALTRIKMQWRITNEVLGGIFPKEISRRETEFFFLHISAKKELSPFLASFYEFHAI